MDAWSRLEKEWPHHVDVTTAEILQKYDSWDTYEQDMSELGYRGPDFLASFLAGTDLPKNAHILDLGCGTGLLGKKLKEDHGFTHVDGHDGSAPMLEKAKQQGFYREYICCIVGNGIRMPVEDNTYDAVVSVGAASPGHFPLDTYDDLVRIVKPGGYFIHTFRAENLDKPNLKDLRPHLESLVAASKLEKLSDFRYENFYNYKGGRKLEGQIQAFRVTKHLSQ